MSELLGGKKILILVPGENARGGITNYYYSIKKEFRFSVDYFLRGSRTYPFRESWINDLLQPLKDAKRFFFQVRKKDYSLLQTTTAFDLVSLVRDTMFIFIARWYKMKVIIFYRGWDQKFADKLEKKYLWFFRKVFFKADAFIELSSDFKKRLLSWGYKKPIYLETTLVNKDLLQGVTLPDVLKKYDNMQTIELLFLSRVEPFKGIYEAIETFRMLQKKYPSIRFTFVGDGRELEKVQQFVKDNNIENIIFTGHVKGDAKIEYYKRSHYFFFPSYSEGMPNAVLEAMAFGLPVITRRVGGLVDFFQNDVHGYFTDSKDPNEFYSYFDKLFSDIQLTKKISENNFHYANEKFVSDKVARRMENIFIEVYESNTKAGYISKLPENVFSN